VLDTTRRASSCGAETLRSGDDGAGDSVEVRDRAGRFVGDDSVAGKSPRGCCRVATILEFRISVRSMRGYPNNKTGATRNSGQVLLGRKLGVDWGSEWGSFGRSGCLCLPGDCAQIGLCNHIAYEATGHTPPSHNNTPTLPPVLSCLPVEIHIRIHLQHLLPVRFNLLTDGLRSRAIPQHVLRVQT